MATAGDDSLHPTPNRLDEARGWLLDCGFDDELIFELTDSQIVRFVDREYEGGWGAFAYDSTGYLVDRLITRGPSGSADALTQWTVMLAKARALGQLQPDDRSAPARNGAGK